MQLFFGLLLAGLLLNEAMPWSMVAVTVLIVLCVFGARRFAYTRWTCDLFGTIKQWMNQGALLMRQLDNVRGEFRTGLQYSQSVGFTAPKTEVGASVPFASAAEEILS